MAAQRPKSAVTADTDVNLDFLTKEEKEALLSKKMDMIRQRNKALTERHKLIEADKKKAEDSGQAVKPSVDSQSLPAEGAIKPRGRGRGQFNQKDSGKIARERPKSHGDFRDSTNYEPIMDTSDLASYKHDFKGKGRSGGGGGGSHKNDFDKDGHSHPKTPLNKRKGSSKDEGPPPDPSFNPLADRRRSDRPDRKEESNNEHRRHPRNFGGGAELNKVKQNMKTQREKEKERPATKKPLEIVMTGKERKNHEDWKAERERYDNERIQRQMDDKGTWRRAWDVDKVPDEFDDSSFHSGRMEPAKRPAGRIGSGRFDRGDRDERPRSGGLPTKGGSQPSNPHQDHSSPPKKVQQPHQQSERHTDHAQSSQPLAQQPQGVRDGGGRGGSRGGRGRGRGRGRGSGSGGQGHTSSGERAPRPRTWSGGDDRLVECQKQQLLVKFDNTVGDDSVEVEYDDVDVALSPPTTPKSGSQSSMTTPRHGPTGRTPNQTGQRSSRGGTKSQGKNAPRSNRGKGNRPNSTHDEDRNFDVHTGRVRSTTSSSHSHSYGDSEEWEDCTGSEDDPNVQSNLHLECKLNPEAPEFLPTSPDFLKTPPGHVKVLNWDASTKPPSSQGSASSPRVLSQSSNPTSPAFANKSPSNQNLSPRASSPHSSLSSPGSSASVRAANRREELDQMPEADQPFDPAELFGAPAAQSSMTKPAFDTKENEEEEQFEDTVEIEPENANLPIQESENKTKPTGNAHSPAIPSHETAEEAKDSPNNVAEADSFNDISADTPLDGKTASKEEPPVSGQSECQDLASELAMAKQNESQEDSAENLSSPQKNVDNICNVEDNNNYSLSGKAHTESKQELSGGALSSTLPLKSEGSPKHEETKETSNTETTGEKAASAKSVPLTKEGEEEKVNPTAENSESS